MSNVTDVMDLDVLSIDRLHKAVGGMSATTNDFVVENNVKLNNTTLNHPYRSEASAVILCVSGEMTVSMNMQKIVVGANSVLMYGRKSMIEILELSDDCRLDMAIFTEDFIKETMLDMKSVMPIFQYFAENNTGILQLEEDEVIVLKKFYNLMHDTASLKKTVITRDLMTAFMRTLAELYSRRITEPQLVKTRQEEYLEKFVRAVDQYHKEHRSVKFYADQLHITPKYLSTVIKDVSGRSAAEWIDDFVIQEAKMLLKFSSKSIQEITYMLNFSTQSFFGKYFKRHTGMSPSEYRMKD